MYKDIMGLSDLSRNLHLGEKMNRNLRQLVVKNLLNLLIICAVISGASVSPVTANGCGPTENLAANQLSRCDYADRLRAMWLGETIANWTGLTTEAVKQDAPFYTDADWGRDQDISWKPNDTIDFVFQDPWLADDDTDIEYVYLHLLNEHNTLFLTPQQIADGWRAHMNDYIWVSNEQARSLMELGVLPPVTGMGTANEHFLQIDAQLTTEIFGALAPGMPEMALIMADLPIRTTASSYAAHAAQFFVVLYSLATQVDATLPPREQNIWLVEEARRYIPGTSKTADIIDFVLADYLANPDVDNWELTRDRVYERYHDHAREHGFVYRGWTESSVNFAAGLLAFLYGEGDFRRTVQIGTLSGWDSDNGTATIGGLLGLMQGYDALIAQFPDVEMSDRYRIHRTRPTMPDYLPEDRHAQDTFTLMADRMLPLVEQAILESGGSVEDDLWTLPGIPGESQLQLNPSTRLSQRSANLRVASAGGTIEVSVAGEAFNSRMKPIADGFEHNFSGKELRRIPRSYHDFGVDAGSTLTVDVIYDRVVEIATIRLIEGGNNSFSQIKAQVLVDGEWLPVPDDTRLSQQSDATIPFQLFDFWLAEPIMGEGIRIVATISDETRLPEIAISELDAFSK
jgi:hypothetical protein